MLSRRESEALQHLANGYLIKEMAVAMSISEYTARDYISQVLKKIKRKPSSSSSGSGNAIRDYSIDLPI